MVPSVSGSCPMSCLSNSPCLPEANASSHAFDEVEADSETSELAEGLVDAEWFLVASMLV